MLLLSGIAYSVDTATNKGMTMYKTYLVTTTFGHYRIYAVSADEARAEAELTRLFRETILSVVEI